MTSDSWAKAKKKIARDVLMPGYLAPGNAFHAASRFRACPDDA